MRNNKLKNRQQNNKTPLQVLLVKIPIACNLFICIFNYY